MSEKFKFSSKQDRADAIDEVRDFVAIDSVGHARVPTGSGSRGGKFLSDHEVKMIEAHASQIYDGLNNREDEALLDAVGILEDPDDIRASLAHNGFINDDEEADWTNKELMTFVDDARKNVANYYNSHDESNHDEQASIGKRRAAVEVDAPSQAEGYVRKQDREVGRHRAENIDESSPIFDELLTKFNRPALTQEAQEGESLEEYEARHAGGRSVEALPVDSLDAIAAGAAIAPAVEPLPVAELDAIARGSASGPEPLPTDVLDAIANSGEATETEDPQPQRTRMRRFRDALTPAGFAASMSSRAEYRRRNSSEDERGKKGLRIALLGAAGMIAAGVGIYLVQRNGDTGSNGGFGNFLNDIADKAKESTDSLSHIDIDKDKSDIASKAHELFGNGSVEVRNGDGYTQVLDRVLDRRDIHLSPNELYDLHQHLEHTKGDYINLEGVNDTYTMANGDSGLSRADSSAQVSEATQKAVVRWLQARGKM